MRLHALILAALSGSAVSALSYDPKVQACAEELGCSCVDLADHPSAAVLGQRWGEAFEHPPTAAAVEALCRATVVHSQLLALLPEA